MQHFVALAYRLGWASLLLALVAVDGAAQLVSPPAANALTRMRSDLAARRYADVIAEANGLLESTRAISTTERIQLWQILAAAYYPDSLEAQQPDSAKLPLAALIRLAPDIKIAPNLSWSGLDALTERTRAESFAVATRPLSEYMLSARAPGYITSVASRPTRFVLTSVADATGRTTVHDSSTYATVAVLQLRAHTAVGPIFTDGTHQLYVWAYDSISGDSLRIAHRVVARRSDLPAPVEDSRPPAEAVLPASPTASPSASPSVSVGASNRRAPTRVATHRSSLLWGGLALAAATAVIAQEARPDDGLRSAFRVDARALIVAAAMSGAAVANFLANRAPPPTSAPPAAPVVAASPSAPPVASPPPVDRYRVRLQIDLPER